MYVYRLLVEGASCNGIASEVPRGGEGTHTGC